MFCSKNKTISIKDTSEKQKLSVVDVRIPNVPDTYYVKKTLKDGNKR